MHGGGDPHRYRLDDAILIKDNHLRVVGSVGQAVSKAKSVSFSKKIEVEVESMEQAVEAAKAGADIIMLDNMRPEQIEMTSGHQEAQRTGVGRGLRRTEPRVGPEGRQAR